MTPRRYRNDLAPWLGDHPTPESAIAAMPRGTFLPSRHVTVVLDYGRAEIPLLVWESASRLERWFRRW